MSWCRMRRGGCSTMTRRRRWWCRSVTSFFWCWWRRQRWIFRGSFEDVHILNIYDLRFIFLIWNPWVHKISRFWVSWRVGIHTVLCRTRDNAQLRRWRKSQNSYPRSNANLHCIYDLTNPSGGLRSTEWCAFCRERTSQWRWSMLPFPG